MLLWYHAVFGSCCERWLDVIGMFLGIENLWGVTHSFINVSVVPSIRDFYSIFRLGT